jgi:sulfite reductase alpha subunit-like flavoprotein
VTGSLSGLPYQPGDVCVVMPKNSSENVEAFFELFPELDRKARIWLEKADSFELPNQAFMPQVTSLYSVFIYRVVAPCFCLRF